MEKATVAITEQLTGIAVGSLPEAVREVKRWATKQLEVPAGDRHLRLLCGLATEEAIHALNADRGIARPTATALVDEGLLTEDEAREDAVAALQREFHRVAIFVWRALRHGPPALPDLGGPKRTVWYDQWRTGLQQAAVVDKGLRWPRTLVSWPDYPSLADLAGLCALWGALHDIDVDHSGDELVEARPFVAFWGPVPSFLHDAGLLPIADLAACADSRSTIGLGSWIKITVEYIKDGYRTKEVGRGQGSQAALAEVDRLLHLPGLREPNPQSKPLAHLVDPQRRLRPLRLTGSVWDLPSGFHQ